MSFDPHVYETYVGAKDLDRLRGIGEVTWEEGFLKVESLREALRDAEGLIVCHGAPRLTEELMAGAGRLRIVGELEGDRFAERIDVEAAVRRGIRVVDTTNGSSYPVSEWALALMLIALRNAGELFRRLIAGEDFRRAKDDRGYVDGELTGKRVGLIGCGHVGRRLIELLRPFRAEVWAYDPYIPKDIPDLMGFTLTSLEQVLRQSNVVVCCAPITPRTRRMIGKRELDMIPPGAVFVNVSRGAIVDPDALIERLRRGDLTAGLDVFDPEPIPADSPIRGLPNVFLSPHIAGVTLASRTRFFSLMADEFERFFHGHETLYDLNSRALANRRGEETPGR
jgi:phosphoglycerate dehydrogenase-like enzyme